MRLLALTVDILLFPLRVICWPFVVMYEGIEGANKWIRRHWRGDGA